MWGNAHKNCTPSLQNIGESKRNMSHELLNLINLDADDNIDESLRLALMFQKEVDEATRAYMEILHMTIEQSARSQDDISQVVKEAINAALLTGIRAYRSWIESEGVDVQAVEKHSGKDIPADFFHSTARWPL
jgi:hypothetical protein